MKKHKVLVVLGIVLVIFLSGYGLLKFNEYRTTEFIEDKEVNIVTNPKELITQLEISDQRNFKIIFKDNKWQEEGFLTIPYDQKLIQQLIDSVVNLKSIQIITNIQDETAYGITENAVVVTVHEKEGQTIVLKVGNYVPAKDGMYVWDESKNTIYVVPKDSMEMILMPKGQLIETTFNLPAFEAINKMTITNSKETIALNRMPAAKEEATKWALEQPFKSAHKVEVEALEPYKEALKQFSKDCLVAYTQDNLELYGLDAPSLKIAINDNLEMIFGNSEEGQTYFIINNEPYIYSMKTDKLKPFHDIKAFDMIQKEVYMPKIEDIKQIQLTNPNKNYDILLKEGTEITSSINDNELDAIKTKEIFDLLNTIIIEAPLVNPELEQKEERTAEITITYTLKDGTTKLIELIPFDTTFYILRTEGNVEFVVGKAPVMNIFNALGTIIKKDAK